MAFFADYNFFQGYGFSRLLLESTGHIASQKGSLVLKLTGEKDVFLAHESNYYTN